MEDRLLAKLTLHDYPDWETNTKPVVDWLKKQIEYIEGGNLGKRYVARYFARHG